MLGRKASIWGKDQVCAVESGIDRVPLRDANTDVCTSLFRGFTQPLCLRSRDNHGSIVVPLPVLPPGLSAGTDSEAKSHAIGVARNVGFWKHDQLCAIVRGLLNGTDGGVRSGRLVEHDGAGLDQGNAADIFFDVFHGKSSYF